MVNNSSQRPRSEITQESKPPPVMYSVIIALMLLCQGLLTKKHDRMPKVYLVLLSPWWLCGKNIQSHGVVPFYIIIWFCILHEHSMYTMLIIIVISILILILIFKLILILISAIVLSLSLIFILMLSKW